MAAPKAKRGRKRQAAAPAFLRRAAQPTTCFSVARASFISGRPSPASA